MRNHELFSTPDAAGVSRVVVWPAALVAALLAHPMLLNVHEAVSQADGVHGEAGWMAVASCTALIAAAHLTICMRGRDAVNVVVRCVALGVVFGPINSGLSLAVVVGLKEGFSLALAGTFLLGATFGLLAGGACGLVLGTVLSPLSVLASAHRLRPTHVGPWVARVVGGLMVLVAAAIHHALLPESFVFQAVATLAGGAAIATGASRLAKVRRFVQAVRAGREPGWALEAPRSATDVAGLHPVQQRGAALRVLYKTHADEAVSPYRAQPQWLPVARLD